MKRMTGCVEVYEFEIEYLYAGEARMGCSGGTVSIFSTFLEKVDAKNIIKRGMGCCVFGFLFCVVSGFC